MLSFHNPHYVPLLVLLVMRFVSEEHSALKSTCEYDTRQLCPQCFVDPSNCDEYAYLFKPQEGSWPNLINSIFNVRSTEIGTYTPQNTLAVMKRLNRGDIIEKLRLEFCQMQSPSTSQCSWAYEGSIDRAVEHLKNSILSESRIEGCIICPTVAKRQTLKRFLGSLEPTLNELWKLLIVRTNVAPLLLMLMSTHEGFFPVPKLLHFVGFSMIESYEGEPLRKFYHHPLLTRMRIARELIKAAFRFTNGINGFRFILTDINPDNVVVRFGNDPNEVFLSIVDLDNIIILDSLEEGNLGDHNYHVHSKIECDGCFAYVQEDVCRNRNSDLNLFAICQLLLENLNGNSNAGLLHSDHSMQLNEPTMPEDNPVAALHSLLKECVYCRPPECLNRSLILEDLLNVISRNMR